MSSANSNTILISYQGHTISSQGVGALYCEAFSLGSKLGKHELFPKVMHMTHRGIMSFEFNSLEEAVMARMILSPLQLGRFLEES